MSFNYIKILRCIDERLVYLFIGGVDMKYTKSSHQRDFQLFGVFGFIENGDRGKAGTKAMNELWEIIQASKLSHKGINHWVYLSDDKLFVGVELHYLENLNGQLEQLDISFNQYVSYLHIGPYHHLPLLHKQLISEIYSSKEEIKYPVIEVFGDWNDDESKLETELIYPI